MAEAAVETTETGSQDGGAPTDDFDAAFDKAAAAQDGSDDDAGSSDDGDDDAGTGDTDSSDENPPEHTQEETRAAEASTKGADDKSKTDDANVRAMLEKLPPELQAQWNKHFTQRSQVIAANEKFLAAFKDNPRAAARSVLEHLGEDEEDGKPAVVVDQGLIKTELAKALKPEQAALVEPLVPVLEKLFNAALGPIKAEQTRIVRANTEERVDSEIESFKKDFPDYDELEPEMDKWMDKIQPTESLSTREFLTVLRTLALGPKEVAAKVQKTVKKMAANAANQPAKTSGVPAASVKPGPSGKLLSFEESAEMALRGETVGKGISR